MRRALVCLPPSRCLPATAASRTPSAVCPASGRPPSCSLSIWSVARCGMSSVWPATMNECLKVCCHPFPQPTLGGLRKSSCARLLDWHSSRPTMLSPAIGVQPTAQAVQQLESAVGMHWRCLGAGGWQVSAVASPCRASIPAAAGPLWQLKALHHHRSPQEVHKMPCN